MIKLYKYKIDRCQDLEIPIIGKKLWIIPQQNYLSLELFASIEPIPPPSYYPLSIRLNEKTSDEIYFFPKINISSDFRRLFLNCPFSSRLQRLVITPLTTSEIENNFFLFYYTSDIKDEINIDFPPLYILYQKSFLLPGLSSVSFFPPIIENFYPVCQDFLLNIFSEIEGKINIYLFLDQNRLLIKEGFSEKSLIEKIDKIGYFTEIIFENLLETEQQIFINIYGRLV